MPSVSANGALRVFDESHRFGLLPDTDRFFDTDIDTLRKRYAAETGVKTETILDLKAGQASFHHSLLLHGSGTNLSDDARLVIAPAYMPDGTFYRNEGQAPSPHSDFLGEARVHATPFAGPHFPLVYGDDEEMGSEYIFRKKCTLTPIFRTMYSDPISSIDFFCNFKLD